MNKILELEKADRELKDASARVDSIKAHLLSLESDISLLNGIRLQILQNITVLKSEKIITSMPEYKKVKEDYETVLRRIYTLRIDHNNYSTALERMEKILLECKSKYATLLTNQDATILRGTFGGKE